MELIRYPNPILNEKSEECTESDLSTILASLNEMTDVMNMYKGIGLAAIQVGILKRYCLLRNINQNAKPHLIINPVIIEADPREEKIEGCLSLPFFFEKVSRSNDITVEYLDETWTKRTAVFIGLEAQCLQHEIDHMAGELILNTVSKMVQDMWIKKAKKKGVL